MKTHTRRALVLVANLLASALLLTSAAPADAQIKRPKTSVPDLVVTTSVNPTMDSGIGQVLATIKVSNTEPSALPGQIVLPGTRVEGIHLTVHFTGLSPVLLSPDSGFHCWISNPGDVTCDSGAVNPGATATVEIIAAAKGPCGDSLSCAPAYTDARVDAPVPERSTTNNRALAVTDLINCIN